MLVDLIILPIYGKNLQLFPKRGNGFGPGTFEYGNAFFHSSSVNLASRTSAVNKLGAGAAEAFHLTNILSKDTPLFDKQVNKAQRCMIEVIFLFILKPFDDNTIF